MANISRRSFMKVAAGAAGIAGLGLLNGCSKTEAPASSAASVAGSTAESTTSAAPVTEKLYTAYINPQLDESEFRSNTKQLTTLVQPADHRLYGDFQPYGQVCCWFRHLSGRPD